MKTSLYSWNFPSFNASRAPSTPISFDELDELPALTKPRPRTLADMFGDLDAEVEENKKKKN